MPNTSMPQQSGEIAALTPPQANTRPQAVAPQTCPDVAPDAAPAAAGNGGLFDSTAISGEAIEFPAIIDSWQGSEADLTPQQLTWPELGSNSAPTNPSASNSGGSRGGSAGGTGGALSGPAEGTILLMPRSHLDRTWEVLRAWLEPATGPGANQEIRLSRRRRVYLFENAANPSWGPGWVQDPSDVNTVPVATATEQKHVERPTAAQLPPCDHRTQHYVSVDPFIIFYCGPHRGDAYIEFESPAACAAAKPLLINRLVGNRSRTQMRNAAATGDVNPLVQDVTAMQRLNTLLEYRCYLCLQSKEGLVLRLRGLTFDISARVARSWVRSHLDADRNSNNNAAVAERRKQQQLLLETAGGGNGGGGGGPPPPPPQVEDCIEGDSMPRIVMSLDINGRTSGNAFVFFADMATYWEARRCLHLLRREMADRYVEVLETTLDDMNFVLGTESRRALAPRAGTRTDAGPGGGGAVQPPDYSTALRNAPAQSKVQAHHQRQHQQQHQHQHQHQQHQMTAQPLLLQAQPQQYFIAPSGHILTAVAQPPAHHHQPPPSPQAPQGYQLVPVTGPPDAFQNGRSIYMATAPPQQQQQQQQQPPYQQQYRPQYQPPPPPQQQQSPPQYVVFSPQQQAQQTYFQVMPTPHQQQPQQQQPQPQMVGSYAAFQLTGIGAPQAIQFVAQHQQPPPPPQQQPMAAFGAGSPIAGYFQVPQQSPPSPQQQQQFIHQQPLPTHQQQQQQQQQR